MKGKGKHRLSTVLLDEIKVSLFEIKLGPFFAAEAM